ncbi:MAG: hypothetical protein ABJJ43_00155 [Ekhidna sp.]
MNQLSRQFQLIVGPPEIVVRTISVSRLLSKSIVRAIPIDKTVYKINYPDNFDYYYEISKTTSDNAIIGGQSPKLTARTLQNNSSAYVLLCFVKTFFNVIYI